MVVAVAPLDRARPALEPEEQDIHVPPAAARVRARHRHAEHPVPPGRHAVGHGRRERPEDRVGVRAGQRVAEGRRGGKLGVQDRPLRDVDADRPQQPVVVRDVGVHEHQKRQDDRRVGRSERRVHEAHGLGVGPRVVEVDVAPALGDRDDDAVAAPRVVAVEEHRGLAAVRTVGDPRELAPHPALRGVEEPFEVALDRVGPVAPVELEHAALADDRAADLRLEVLGDDREADVREDQIPHVAPEPALFDDPERRDPERLLPHLGRLRVVAARLRPADVRLVALRRRPRHEPPGVEDRAEHGDVVVLVSAGEDVVVEEDVTRTHVVAEGRDDRAARRLEREGEDRDVLGLLEDPPARVVEPGDEVARLVEDRRARRPEEREPHLLGDRPKPALQHRREDGIDALHPSSIANDP